MAGRGQNQGNGKNKHAFAPKPKIPPPPKEEPKGINLSMIGRQVIGRGICPQTQKSQARLGLCSLVALSCLKKSFLEVMERCKNPYTHQVERDKDFLGLIHTDVCGPFKITSRQGASYFVTFTDDFSRCGYVYLLKHKHEVFETFKDYRPSYFSLHSTTQWCQKRNKPTNMVDAMMSQTTLPKSFWDYALETAARILNMVPTKKVEKTPYEVWHGQAPKLSYLKVWGCEALVKRDTLPHLTSRLRSNIGVSSEEHQRKQCDIPSTTHPRTKCLCCYECLHFLRIVL
ncbi:retrotransposon protein, putative, ty1-copia subclass [Tanacetum coccineum]